MKIIFYDNNGFWEFSNVKEIVINEKGTNVTYIDIFGKEHQVIGETPNVIVLNDIPAIKRSSGAKMMNRRRIRK